MKVARLYSFGDIRIEEMPTPEPGPGEALMRTRASGICSGDTMPWYIEKKAPLVLGHEPAGEIVSVGQGVRSVRPGDRVFVHHHAPCFECPRCMRGDHVQCEAWRTSRIHPGGIAEYVLIPKINLEGDTIALPDSLSFEDGTIIEPLACAVKAVKRARVKKGDTALVIGLGFMGILNALCLRKYGAKRVIGVDRQAWRIEKARSLGIEAVSVSGSLPEAMDTLTDGLMANIVVVCPNSINALTEGIKSAAPGGTVLMFTPALPGEILSVDPNELYFKDVSLVPSYSCGPSDTADAVELLASGALKADALVTHRFPIEQAAEAFRLTSEARESLKCLIVFQDA